MPRTTDKSLFESELSPTIKDELVKSLLEPRLLNDDTYHSSLDELLELAYWDTIRHPSFGRFGRAPVN